MIDIILRAIFPPYTVPYKAISYRTRIHHAMVLQGLISCVPSQNWGQLPGPAGPKKKIKWKFRKKQIIVFSFFSKKDNFGSKQIKQNRFLCKQNLWERYCQTPRSKKIKNPKPHEMGEDRSSRAENWTDLRKISMRVFSGSKKSQKKAK